MQLQLWIQPLICAPGTHYCWVATGNVDIRLNQGFFHMTGAAEIEPQMPRSRINTLYFATRVP